MITGRNGLEGRQMPRPNRYDRMYPRPVPPDDTMPEVLWPPPKAPAFLTEPQRKHFDEIVSGNPHLIDIFDRSLLAAYVQLCEEERKLSARVAKDGPIFNGRIAVWYRAWMQASRLMLRYMHALKLGPLYRDA
jgi:hypothetical protein